MRAIDVLDFGGKPREREIDGTELAAAFVHHTLGIKFYSIGLRHKPRSPVIASFY